jgi:hypothetical protein
MTVGFDTSGQLKRTSGNTLSLTVGSLPSYVLVFLVGGDSMEVTSITFGSATLNLLYTKATSAWGYKIMAFGGSCLNTGAQTLTINANTGWYGAHAAIFTDCERAEFSYERTHIEGHTLWDLGSFYYTPVTSGADMVVDCIIVGWGDATNTRTPSTPYGATILGSQTYGTTPNHPPMSCFSYEDQTTPSTMGYWFSPGDIASGDFLAMKLIQYTPFLGRGYLVQ